MKIPKVTGRLREVTAEHADNPGEIVERCYRAISKNHEIYGELSSSTKTDVMESIRCSAVLWFKSMLTGEGPSDEDMDVFRSLGRRRVHQGVDLASLLRAYRVGSKELWAAYIEFASRNEETQHDLLFKVSPYLLEHFDEMAQSIASAYMEEQYEQSRWRDALRYELCNLVFNADGDAGDFSRVSEALGIDPTIGRVAFVFDIHTQEIMPSRMEAELDKLQLLVARMAKTGATDLVRAMYRGRLIIWVPCIRGDSLLASDRKMAELASRLVGGVTEFKQVGVGLMGLGPSGWAGSVDEALKALEIGGRNGGGEGTYRYSDIALYEGARRSDNVLRYFESLIERLSHEPDLLRTLECYLGQFQKRKPAASELGIHPNTLNYRLQRIQDITGGSVEDPAWLAKLHVAMRLRQGSL